MLRRKLTASSAQRLVSTGLCLWVVRSTFKMTDSSNVILTKSLFSASLNPALSKAAITHCNDASCTEILRFNLY